MKGLRADRALCPKEDPRAPPQVVVVHGDHTVAVTRSTPVPSKVTDDVHLETSSTRTSRNQNAPWVIGS